MVSSVDRLKLVEKGVLGVTILAVIVVVLIILSLFVVPYAPLTFLKMKVQVREVCPEDSVPVTVEYYIDESDFEGLRGVGIKSDWVAVDVPDLDVGARRPATTDQFITPNLLNTGYNDRTSRVLRIAPQRPGVWHLENTERVYGNKWGIPVPPQKITESAEEDTTVLDPSDPKCQQSSRGSRNGELVRGLVYSGGSGKANVSSRDLAGVATGQDKLDN